MQKLKVQTKLEVSLSSTPPLMASKPDITPLTLLPAGCRMQKAATTYVRITEAFTQPLCHPTLPPATPPVLVLIGFTNTWIAESVAASYLVELPRPPYATTTVTRANISVCQSRKTSHTMSSFIKTEEIVITGIFRTVVLMVTPQWTFWFRRRKHIIISGVSFIRLIGHGGIEEIISWICNDGVCLDIYYSNHYGGKF